MLPSNMELRIKTGTVGYNNKIIISNGKFILGKNDEVNSLETAVMKTHKDSNLVAQTSVTHRNVESTAATHRDLEQIAATHEEEKIALIFSLPGIFIIWNMF